MQNKKTDKVFLRCYAYPGENAGKNGYFAFCIDLSLSTWRPTFAAAKSSLNDAINGYIETVVKNASPEECKNFRRLILRPAPFFPYKAEYYFVKAVSTWRHRNQQNRKTFKRQINQATFCAA